MTTSTTSSEDKPTKATKPKAKKKANGESTSPRTIECRNPATGELIAEIDAATPDQVDEAVGRARRAFRTWSRYSVAERNAILLEAREILLDHRDELWDLLVQETGKVRPEAAAELLMLFDTIGYYTKNAEDFLADETISLHLLKNKRVSVQYPPVGVVVNISPWNFPLDLAINPIIPALLAGNAAIVKPSEVTPLIAMRVAELINQAGLPDGLLQVIPGYGDVGASLITKADAVTFTGSVATGRKVAVEAAKSFIPCTLELGGKDPAIVLDDADIERAARGIVYGAFFNSGQVCMSTERAYVHEAVYDQFVDRVVELTKELRQGEAVDFDVDVGAMIFPRQIDIVEDHIQDAIDKGARVLTGGKRRHSDRGDFFEPTVIVDVDHSMKCMKDETFGPTLPVMKVSSTYEAIELANESIYGLNSSVWSKDSKRANEVARQIESGQVCINDVFISYLAIEAPYGGIKHSGIGRRKGRGEMRKYTQSKTVLEDIFGLKREPVWYPYDATLGKALGKAFGVLFRKGIGGKVADLFRD